MISGPIARTSPVQWPLARRRVILSRRVIAYLWPHPSLSATSASLCIRRTALSPSVFSRVSPRGSPIYSACLSLRAVFHTPLDREGAFDRFFPSRVGFRQFRNVSASKCSTQAGSSWWVHEAAKFTSCYGPADLLALHRSGLLRSSLHSLCHHRKRRVLLHGYTVNSRGWTYTSKTRSIMGCERNEPNPGRDGEVRGPGIARRCLATSDASRRF